MSTAGDCDDADATVYPDAEEICDDLDNNRNGLIDDEDPRKWSQYSLFDSDGDGFGNAELMGNCGQPEQYVDNDTDCDDLKYRNQSCSRRSL